MKVAIFDTETTDLISNSALKLDKQPHIVEFSGKVIDDETGEILAEIDFLCDPGIPMPAESSKITGLKTEDLKGLPSFASRIKEVQDFLDKAEAIVAHNLSYDHAITDFEAKRAGVELKWPSVKICTVESTEHLKGFRLNLSSLHELLFGVQFEGSHRAKADVDALVRCYLELKKQGEL